MSYTPGKPEDDCYAPLSHDQAQALSDALDEAQAQQMPWWRRAIALPCFLALAGAQVVRRRAREWRGKP